MTLLRKNPGLITQACVAGVVHTGSLLLGFCVLAFAFRPRVQSTEFRVSVLLGIRAQESGYEIPSNYACGKLLDSMLDTHLYNYLGL